MNIDDLLSKATDFLDQVVPKYVSLSSLSYQKGYAELDRAFAQETDSLRAHLKGHWKGKGKDFAQFYLNLDEENRTALLEYWNIRTPELPDYYDGSEILYRFLLMANNNSLEFVKSIGEGEGGFLYDWVKYSKVQQYGNGTNWGKYYHRLALEGVPNRSSVVLLALSYR